MWTVVYMAQDSEMADKVQKKLTENGLIVKIRAVNNEKNCFEILVPSEEVSQAHNVIIEIDL